MKLTSPFPYRHAQRGVTLIEALVALLVMSFGMVALVALLSNLQRMGDVSKQRSEAMRLALEDVATVRDFSTLVDPNPPDPTVLDYENDIISKTQSNVQVPDSNTAFTVQRTVTPLITGSDSLWARSVQVDVSWFDRASRSTDTEQQRVTFNTIVSRVDPSFVGALSIGPTIGGLRQPLNRSPAVPVDAVDLGNKSSAFRPSGLSGTVWVFSNVSGVITKTCTILAGTSLTASSVAAAGCTDTLAFVISGTVNFSNTNPANPAIPEATAIVLDMTIVGGSYSAARLDSNGAPVEDASHNVIWDTVTVAAPTSQCFDDAPTATPTGPISQTFVNYHCIVYPFSGSVPPYWSGMLKMTNLSLGTTATDYRVCRYSADYNGNGNGYANSKLEPDNYEHPAFYVKVTGSLPRQNFLVVKGNVSCPTAPAIDLNAGIFANYSTLQLQP